MTLTNEGRKEQTQKKNDVCFKWGLWMNGYRRRKITKKDTYTSLENLK